MSNLSHAEIAAILWNKSNDVSFSELSNEKRTELELAVVESDYVVVEVIPNSEVLPEIDNLTQEVLEANLSAIKEVVVTGTQATLTGVDAQGNLVTETVNIMPMDEIETKIAEAFAAEPAHDTDSLARYHDDGGSEGGESI